MFERFANKRRRSAKRNGKRRGKLLGHAALAWASGLRRNPWAFFIAGLGLGIIIGVALAVHRGPAPNMVASMRGGSTTLPKLAPPPAAPAGDVAAPPLAPLPKAAGGKPAWQQFALAMPATGGRPVIAIVIDDMGIDKADSARVIGLPGPLTIAFMSYASELDSQSHAARAAGDE